MPDTEVVIVDEQGVEHVFPSGFDPKKAAQIVKSAGMPQHSTLDLMSVHPTVDELGHRVDPKTGRNVEEDALTRTTDALQGVAHPKGLGDILPLLIPSGGNMLPRQILNTGVGIVKNAARDTPGALSFPKQLFKEISKRYRAVDAPVIGFDPYEAGAAKTGSLPQRRGPTPSSGGPITVPPTPHIGTEGSLPTERGPVPQSGGPIAAPPSVTMGTGGQAPRVTAPPTTGGPIRIPGPLIGTGGKAPQVTAPPSTGGPLSIPSPIKMGVGGSLPTERGSVPNSGGPLSITPRPVIGGAESLESTLGEMAKVEASPPSAQEIIASVLKPKMPIPPSRSSGARGSTGPVRLSPADIQLLQEKSGITNPAIKFKRAIPELVDELLKSRADRGRLYKGDADVLSGLKGLDRGEP